MDISDLPRRASIALLRKWVKALRSGRYKQTNGALRNSKGYCCLGVLGRVAGVPATALDGGSYMCKSDTQRKSFRLLPPATQYILGLLNDLKHKTFPQIADHVEKRIIPRHTA